MNICAQDAYVFLRAYTVESGGGKVRPLSSQLHLPDVDGSVSRSKRLSTCSADACEYSVSNSVVKRVGLVESKF